jgi:ATP-dependent helicase HrpB
VRFEDRTSASSRIVFMTEGILLRRMQSDPELSRVGVLIFDEFHERNLMSDAALALARDLQRTRRPDLKLVVMSATLEAEPVARYLAEDKTPAGEAAGEDTESGEGVGEVGELEANQQPAGLGKTQQHDEPVTPPGHDKPDASTVPIVISEGRTYPVEIRWADYTEDRLMIDQAAAAVEDIIERGWEGDILVFMPGKQEIHATLAAIRAQRFGESIELLPLHGELPPQEQDRVFQSCPRRKVIVSTNVAETSVTIDGVRHVIDSGWVRVARYDPERGIQTLNLEPISRASADQRAGRAGRTAPGTCWRLWTEGQHGNRDARNTPEIQRADLAGVVLLLHSLGVREASEFGWLDRPDIAAVRRAERLLVLLGALDGRGDITAVGREMLKLPVHPRFARMLVEARRRNCVAEAALCAALVGGRDLLTRVMRGDRHAQETREEFEARDTSDFYTLIHAYEFAAANGFAVEPCRRNGIHAHAARSVAETFHHLLRLTGTEDRPQFNPGGDPDADRTLELSGKLRLSMPDVLESLEKCLLAGAVDQLAARRDTGSLACDLVGGRQATLARESVVQKHRLFVASQIREVSGRDGVKALLLQCTGVDAMWVQELFPEQVNSIVECLYDRTHKRVAAMRRVRFQDLVIDQSHERTMEAAASGECLADAVLQGWIELPNWDHGVRQFMARVDCVRQWQSDLGFPEWDTPTLRALFSRAFEGLTLAKEAQAIALLSVFQKALQPELREWLDELAPTRVKWVRDQTLKLVYVGADPEAKRVASVEAQVKLVDCFGMSDPPMVGEGKVPVRLRLHLPDGKRLADTADWAGWKLKEYPGVRTMLKTKYPGFLWP